MSESDQDVPKENPEALELRARPQPTSRLNRRLVVVVMGGAFLALLLSMMWGARREPPTPPSGATDTRVPVRVPEAEGLRALPKDYASIPTVPKLGPPLGELGNAKLQAERQRALQSGSAAPDFTPDLNADTLRARELQELKEADAAARSAVLPQSHRQRARMSAPGATSPPTMSTKDAVHPEPLGASRTEASDQMRKEAFLNRESDRSTRVTVSVTRPSSRYDLLAGTVLSGALLTGIQSDLPGQAIATITENVYDSLTGQHLLIPQGSRLMGEYDSSIAYGQERVLLVWTRLIRPDGSSIVLDRLPATDAQGRSGLHDKVDWHWRKLLAGAAVSSVLGAGAEMAAPNTRDGQDAAVIAMREGIQDSTNEVGQELTRRNLDIQPTLTLRPGLPLRIVTSRDLTLPPYES